MRKQLLYKELASYYDLLYSYKDYKKEAEQIRKIINKHRKSKEKELLDVGCGTGKHLKYLKKWFSCTGVDPSKPMLSIAKKMSKARNSGKRI